MLKRTFILFFLLLTAIPSFASTVLQYEQMRVAKIDVVAPDVPAAYVFDPVTIRARLQTKVGNYFSQYEFDQDLKCLVEDYAQVEPSIQVINNELYITLTLWLKPTIRSITFCGNERVSTKKLVKELGVSAGCPFDREQFINAFNKLKLLYIKKGYFESQLDFATTSPDGCNEIDIQISICEGRAGRIKKIKFYGFDPCEQDDLLEMMATQRYNFLLSWFTGRGNYHPDMIEHDRLLILTYLQNEGYADAVVSLCTEESTDCNKINLIITADKGVCYSFGNIFLEGNQIFCRQDIWDQFLFGRGGTYSPDALRETIAAIQDLYGSFGYIDAAVDVQLSLREDCPIYDVSMAIEEGNQYCVGMIRVFGNCSTQTKIILQESLLCPGEVFDIRKLEATETRLVNTGYFSNVNVYAVRSLEFEDQGDCPAYRDVYIEVEETDTGNLGLFFGFNSLESIFGGVDVAENNFNILGIANLLNCGPRALRGAGEYAHFKANIGNKQTSYLFQWTKPYFMDTPWIVGFDLEKTNNRILSKGYEIKTYGGNVTATYIWNDFLKYAMHYRGRHTHVAVKDNLNPELAAQADNSGFISAVGADFIYDSTDHPRRPTSGFRSRLYYEVAGLGGNYQFMKMGYVNTYYYPLCRKGVLKFRADVNFVHTYGHTNSSTLPLSERIFLGGETTVRGYRPFILGPKYGNNEPQGGLSSYLLSEEFQYTLLKVPSVDAFVFIDAGFVSTSEFTIGRQAASVGFGVRLEVMKNMPITLGLGFPIHPYEKRFVPGEGEVVFDNTQRFFFAMGGAF